MLTLGVIIDDVSTKDSAMETKSRERGTKKGKRKRGDGEEEEKREGVRMGKIKFHFSFSFSHKSSSSSSSAPVSGTCCHVISCHSSDFLPTHPMSDETASLADERSTSSLGATKKKAKRESSDTATTTIDSPIHPLHTVG